MRVVLGVSGGIAAYKACSLLRLFTEHGHDVTVVPTAAALQFVGAPTWSALSGKPVSTEVWTSVHEVPHVRIGQSADLVVVAPATADLLAKAAHGLADDLLTNTLLTARCPVAFAPAMHTEMWEHPATQANVATLRSRGAHVIEPAVGRLTGKDSGAGRLPEPEALYAACLAIVAGDGSAVAEAPLRDLEGRRVVVSAGGTREPLDPVRYLGNRSSGKQGVAIARAAAERGAKVTLVAANVSLPVPDGIDVVAGRDDARAAAGGRGGGVGRRRRRHGRRAGRLPPGAREREQDQEVVRPRRRPAASSSSRTPTSSVGSSRTATPVGRARRSSSASPPRRATPHGSVMDHARAKFVRKGSDLQVVNEVGADLTFGKDDTTVHLLRRGTDEATTVGPTSKDAVADALWDTISPLLD